MAEGFGANDLNQRLLRERIVFLGSQVDQNTANRICAELLLLEAEDRDKDISLYINSPGGSVYRRFSPSTTPCSTSTATSARSASAWPPRWVSSCSAPGAPGKRFSLPHSRILMHQPSMGGMQGQASDIAIQAEQIIYMKKTLAERICLSHRPDRRAHRDRLGP